MENNQYNLKRKIWIQISTKIKLKYEKTSPKMIH